MTGTVKGRRSKVKGATSGTVSAVVAIVLAALLVPAVASAQQTIIFVRHAERADGGAGAGMGAAPADPALSAAGEARAARLAAMLADAGIKAIVATEFRRTQDTGKPLAAKLGLTVEVVPAKDTAGLVAMVKRDHASDVVLVIGHSNTLPDLIKAFGGRAITMRDDEYDALYVLSPGTGALTLIRYEP
jgi:broad specificity phosphatase PhoE